MSTTGASNAEQIGINTSINFRPSQNFRLMKKYKSMGESSGTQYSSTEHGNRVAEKVVVQPPLPPNSPPPDFVVKQEEVDSNVYENNEQYHNASSLDPETSIPQNVIETPRRIMCKDFVRGVCKRDPCFFEHEIDLAQLKGVYKFCRDFANGKCRRPNCTYVHATTFEKENFYRTGQLPPETLSHIENCTSMPTIPAEPVPVFNFGEPQNAEFQFRYASQFASSMSYPSLPGARPALAPANINYLPIPPMTAPSAAGSYPPAPPPFAPADAGAFLYTAPQPPVAVSMPMHVSQEVYPARATTHIHAEKEPCLNCRLAEIKYQQTLAKIQSIDLLTRQLNENIGKLDARKEQLICAITKVISESSTELPKSLW